MMFAVGRISLAIVFASTVTPAMARAVPDETAYLGHLSTGTMVTRLAVLPAHLTPAGEPMSVGEAGAGSAPSVAATDPVSEHAADLLSSDPVAYFAVVEALPELPASAGVREASGGGARATVHSAGDTAVFHGPAEGALLVGCFYVLGLVRRRGAPAVAA